MTNYKARCVRQTRRYVRRMIKNADVAFVIGFEDAENGNPLVPKGELFKDGKSTAAEDFCYSLYEKGYHAGMRGGEEK